MSEKVLIFLDEWVEDMEFLYPYYRLKEEIISVQSAAPEIKSYTGKKGMSFKPDVTIDEIKNEQFTTLIIPGGFAPDKMRRNPDLLKMVRQHHENNCYIVSICHGPWVLISAGIVKDRKIAATPAIKDDLVNAGAIFSEKGDEEDGNILTSSNPQTMLPMMKRFMSKIRNSS